MHSKTQIQTTLMALVSFFFLTGWCEPMRQAEARRRALAMTSTISTPVVVLRPVPTVGTAANMVEHNHGLEDYHNELVHFEVELHDHEHDLKDHDHALVDHDHGLQDLEQRFAELKKFTARASVQPKPSPVVAAAAPPAADPTPMGPVRRSSDGRPINVTTQAELDKLLASGKVVVVDFWADWCGPCRAIAPSLRELASEMKDKLVIVKVDIDKAPALNKRYNNSGRIPYLALFLNGSQIDEMSGAYPKPAIAAWIGQYL